MVAASTRPNTGEHGPDDLGWHVRRCRAIAWSVARRSGQRWLADELLGAAGEGLARALRTWDPSYGVPFEVWARTCAYSAAWDAARNWGGRRGPKPGAMREGDAERTARTLSGGDSPEQRCLDRAELEEFAARLALLDDRAREAVVGVARGETLTDIATRWGVTMSRLSQVHTKALAYLRYGRQQPGRIRAMASTTDTAPRAELSGGANATPADDDGDEDLRSCCAVDGCERPERDDGLCGFHVADRLLAAAWQRGAA